MNRSPLRSLLDTHFPVEAVVFLPAAVITLAAALLCTQLESLGAAVRGKFAAGRR
ncbi:MAG: hypothetical protein HY302_08190 [Opitutae bacterium]|nr:hypothetical protein [Opitutae bacterium]